MNFLEKVSNGLTEKAGQAGFVIKKRSPEILLAVGVISFVGTVVVACRATLKADRILDHHAEKVKDIEDAKEIAEEQPEEYDYDEEMYKRDMQIQTIKTGVDLAKAYAPAIALGALSLTCILVSRNILNKRYLGAVAAYNAVSAAFNEYRQRVRDEAGEMMDRHYRYGTELETVTVETVDEDGKKHKEKILQEKEGTAKLPAGGAIWFDESNPKWDRNPNFNMAFLKGVQSRCNDILHARGYIFLNEVYDALGFVGTQEGAVIGWILGAGDDEVDFGLYRDENQCRKFVNGEANRVLLDFNHDGPIWDKLPKRTPKVAA